MRVDARHHPWGPASGDYGWLAPDLRGKAAIAGPPSQGWHKATDALASLFNVSVKLSGLPTETPTGPDPSPSCLTSTDGWGRLDRFYEEITGRC